MTQSRRPNLLMVLIDDLRFDEFGAGGHPYMVTPHIDRLAHEGALFERAFHTTPICSPNRASILTGQYASRHGIIDNVARDAMSHRLANYNLTLQSLGYETAHVGKWHMGNTAVPRPGYDHWVSFEGHGRIEDPVLNIGGATMRADGYVNDILTEKSLEFIDRHGAGPRERPFAMALAHKAVHPDAEQAADGVLQLVGYLPAERHRDLYRGAHFPPRPNVLPPDQVIASKPAWAEAFDLKSRPSSRALLDAIAAGTQEEIRLRAATMASVDEGIGEILALLERRGELDDTMIVFLGDNGYFFGEHGLGPERRFAYEEGIRAPFLVRYPKLVPAGSRIDALTLCQDIAPTFIELAGGRPGQQIQGRSLLPLFGLGSGRRPPAWREDILLEYWAENAMPWLVGMTYKAVRTDRYKYIHWVNRGTSDELDELYDLDADPYELNNVVADPARADVRSSLRARLRTLVADSLGL
jgi:arylsulfatase A-like enzyme